MERHQDLERKKGTGPKSILVKGLLEWTGVATPGRREAKKNRETEKQDRIEKESIKTFGGGLEMLRRMTESRGKAPLTFPGTSPCPKCRSEEGSIHLSPPLHQTEYLTLPTPHKKKEVLLCEHICSRVCGCTCTRMHAHVEERGPPQTRLSY